MSLFSHIYVGSDEDQYKGVFYSLQALAPFDALKVILEQILYYHYVYRTCGYTPLMGDVRVKIESDLNAMPMDIQGGDPALVTLYHNGILTAKDWMADYPENWRHMPPQDLFAIFYTPNQRNYVNREYTSTLSEHFLTVLLAFLFQYYDVDKYPARQLMEGALHVPGVTIETGYHPAMSQTEQRLNNKAICIKLSPLAVAAIDLEFPRIPQYPNEWITNYNLSQFTVDDLVAIMSNFSIDRSRYAMTDSGIIAVPDICYDLVSGSHIVPAIKAGNDSDASLADNELRFVKEMLAKGYIRPSEDAGLFGELLSKLGASSDLYNYFMKPVELISAAEAYAFRSSSLASFMAERLIPGMAAADEDTKDEDKEDDEDSDTDDQGGEQDTGTSEDTPEGGDDTDVGGDDGGLDLGSTDATQEEDKPAEDKKPHIDPDRMLLELANPNQSMSDYIFREMVARRISEVLKNPPQNAMPNDLLMLKRWRSRWLYLVNVPCLRDFLTRLSLRLSDV